MSSSFTSAGSSGSSPIPNVGAILAMLGLGGGSSGGGTSPFSSILGNAGAGLMYGGPIGALLGAGLGAVTGGTGSSGPQWGINLLNQAMQNIMTGKGAAGGTQTGASNMGGFNLGGLAGILGGGGGLGGLLGLLNPPSGTPDTGTNTMNLPTNPNDWLYMLSQLYGLSVPGGASGTKSTAGSTGAGTRGSGVAGAGGSSLLGQLLGLGTTLGGSLTQSSALSNAIGLLGNTANQYRDLGAQGVSNASPWMNQAAGAFNGTLNGSSPYMNLINNSLIPNVGELNNLLPGLSQRNLATESPDIMKAISEMGTNANSGPLAAMLAAAQQNVANGGATPQTSQQLQSYQNMQAGNTPAMQSLLGLGSSLTGSGGMNSTLNGLSGAGYSSATTGGMTPQLASALSEVQSMLTNGGSTPTIDALQQRGLQLSSANPLLPMSAVLSGAENSAATNEAKAAENARAQAIARGGGPGATVANGVQNQAMADFADQGAQAQAAAVQNALMSQQQLQLGQLNSGASMAQGGAGLNVSNLNSLLGAISNLTSTSTGRMATGGNLALGAQGQGTQNMSLGGNLLNSYNNSSQASGSLADAILSLQMGNQNSSMAALNAGVGTQSGMLNSIMSQLMSGAQQGGSLGNQLGQNYLSNQSQYGNILGGAQGSYQNAANLLGGLGGNWLNFGGNMYGDMGPVVTSEANFSSQSPFSQFLNGLGGSLMAGGINIPGLAGGTQKGGAPGSGTNGPAGPPPAGTNGGYG